MEPLGAVGHPEGDFVAGLDAEVDEGAGGAVDVFPELLEGPAAALEGEGLAGAVPAGGVIEQCSQGTLFKPFGHDGVLPVRCGCVGENLMR